MRVFIADDHPIFLDAICEEVGRAGGDISVNKGENLESVLNLGDQLSAFDVLVIDFSMPGMDGVEGVRKVLVRHPGANIAIMSGVALPADVKAVIDAGAKGFIPKTLNGGAFVAAVNLIAAGGTFVPTDYLGEGHDADNADQHPRHDTFSLTPRENEVLAHIVEGQSNKEIAHALEIEEVTVKLHARRIFQKLGVKNRVQAAKAAMDAGLYETM